MGKKKSDVTAIPKGWPAPPFLMTDTASVAGTKLVVLERTALAWLAVEFSPYTYIRDVVVHDRHTSRGPTRGRRYHPWEHNTNLETGERRTFQKHVEGLRSLALQHGATPEAIRLLDAATKPFTQKEVEDMANKLSKKTEAPKKEAKAPKSEKKAAKEGAAPKRKGNPEALAKARAARAEAGPDTRKIKILNKENPYREGSNRAASFDALKGAKTVEDYVSNGGKKKYLSRWADDGIIELG